MKIAIIGGGASGLITSYLLRNVHQTTVFEASPILGGHIRTLNRNVTDVNLEPGVVAENGVLGFDLTAYPTFGRLAARLNLELEPYVMHSGLFYDDGSFWVTPSPYQKITDSRRQRLMNLLRLLPLWSRRKRLIASLDAVAPRISTVGPPPRSSPSWMNPAIKLCLHVSCSRFRCPSRKVGEMPAELTIGYMQGGRLPNWYFLRGGVYSYIETMLARMPAGHQRLCNAPVESVTRDDSGVLVRARGQAVQAFDKVVFATDPGQVLKILADATDVEKDASMLGRPILSLRWLIEISVFMILTIRRSSVPVIISDFRRAVTLDTTPISITAMVNRGPCPIASRTTWMQSFRFLL